MAASRQVQLRYWAAAAAAAGTNEAELELAEPISLTELLARINATKSAHFGRVIAVCAVLVNQVPMKSVAPDEVTISPGDVVEFLPPFAGG